MRHEALFVIGTVLLAAWLSACGYHFAGSGSYPAGVTRIFITILENRSAETGVENTVTNDLIFEFTRKRKASLVQDRLSADGILSGTIASLSVENIARASVAQAVERRVTATLRLQLESPDGRLLWSSGDIVERQAYSVVAGDKVATDLNKAEAIAFVSQKLAESAFNRLTEDF
jgi:outer membrane lipopolysaccharide assembly protein LptE/RlpB